jgi:hypothetical protein
MSGNPEFSLYWWDRDGGQHREMQFVQANTAFDRMTTLTRGPAAKMGVVKKVMITDGMDFCVLLWEDGKLVHPSPEILAEAREQS